MKTDPKELLVKRGKRASHESLSAPSQNPIKNKDKGVKRIATPQGLQEQEMAADEGCQHIFGRWEVEEEVVSHKAVWGRQKA